MKTLLWTVFLGFFFAGCSATNPQYNWERNAYERMLRDYALMSASRSPVIYYECAAISSVKEYMNAFEAAQLWRANMSSAGYLHAEWPTWSDPTEYDSLIYRIGKGPGGHELSIFVYAKKGEPNLYSFYAGELTDRQSPQ